MGVCVWVCVCVCGVHWCVCMGVCVCVWCVWVYVHYIIKPYLLICIPRRALQEADVILLLGARLNWILHFGLPPRFNSAVKIIQVHKTFSYTHTLYSIYHVGHLLHVYTCTYIVYTETSEQWLTEKRFEK